MGFSQNRQRDGFLPRRLHYYRRIIPHFALYAEIVYKQMLEVKQTVSEVLQTAVAKFKDELLDGVAVKFANQAKRFLVETYAGIHALGAVLLQSEGDQEYPTLFYSQALNAAQRNYSTNEGAILAVVKACHSF